MKSFWWGALFWISALMIYIGVTGKSEAFALIWLGILLWSWKKHSDSEAEKEPKKRNFTLGQVEIFNEVLQKYTASEEKIIVNCLEPFRKVYDFKSYPSQYIEHKILVREKEYSPADLVRFVIDNDEGIMRHYATQASIKRATGNGGQSISDAIARQRDLREARRLLIEFTDGTSYLLSNVDESIAKDIEKLLLKK